MKNKTHEFALDCIYQALVKLMEDKPYQEITITDITKKAGVSRMAYYRNFSEKDDILLNHLKDTTADFELKLSNRQSFSEENIWREIVNTLQNNPIIESIIKAGLFGRAFPILKESMTNTYMNIFHWDIGDEDTLLVIYERLGSLFGVIQYMIEQKQDLNTDLLVKHVMSLAEAEH